MQSLWDSYDNMYYSFKVIGYPEKDKYIEDNYIEPIRILKNVYLLSDEEMAEQFESLDNLVAAYVSADENGNKYMCLKQKPDDSEKYDEYLDTLQHELRHAYQGFLWDDDYRFLARTLSEGYAVLGEINKYRRNEINDAIQFFTEKETQSENHYLIIGRLGSCTDYAILANMMVKLILLVGYDNMLKLEKGEISCNDIISIISEELGEEETNIFIDNIKTSFLNYERIFWGNFQGIDYNEEVDDSEIIDVENTILNVLKTRIENAKTKEEVQAYYNFYYLYKKFYCVRYCEIIYYYVGEEEYEGNIHKIYDQKVTDKSCDVLILDDIEDLLVEKSLEYNAISKISDNELLNKVAIKALLADDEQIGTTFEAPFNLQNEVIYYAENTDTDISNGEILMGRRRHIMFDMNGNISINWNGDLDNFNSSAIRIMNMDNNDEESYTIDGITLTLSKDGTLTIKGGGKIQRDSIELFDYLNKIKKVVIEGTISSIGNKAFYKCEELTNIEIPESVTEIEEGAFEECKKLEKVSIPKGVRIIKDNTFKNCKKLSNVELSDGLRNISTNSFLECSSLENITIPNSVTAIFNNAFKDCTNLKNINMSNSILTIGDNTFENCQKLEKIILPKSIVNIGKDTFKGCSDNFTIYGYENSKAQEYATANNIKFELLENEDEILNNASEYYIEETRILGIKPSTEISDFESNFNSNYVINITKGGNTITEGLIATGMEIQVMLNGEEKAKITAVVTGDLTGNGKMGIGDLTKLSRYAVGLDLNLTGPYLEASDLVKDGKYGRIGDITKMSRILAGLDNL